jgi:hypothetical protein
VSMKAFGKIMAGLKEALGIARGEIPVEQVRRPWTVDRDGRVRTDKDRPIVLRAVKQ